MKPTVLVTAATFAAGAFLCAAAASASDVTVAVTAGGFAPASATIAAGEKVRFVSGDAKPHQLSKASGPDNSGDLLPDVLDARGKRAIVRLGSEGTYTYVDRIGGRTFRVTVTPAAISKR